MAHNAFWMTPYRRHLGFFAGAPTRRNFAGHRLPLRLQAAPRVERLEDRLVPAPLADVGVTKTGPATVTAGLQATYTITVSNSGPNDAQNVVLSDALPANSTFAAATQLTGPAFTQAAPPPGGAGTLSEFAATLPNGASAVFQIVFNINASASGTISNSASVSSAADPNAANDSSTANSIVDAQADVSVTKTGTFTASLYFNSQAGDYIGGGQTVTYTSATGSFKAQGDGSFVSFSYQEPNFTHWWYLEFAAPNHAMLTPGYYSNAARAAFRDNNQPGLDIFGDGRGSNTLTGNFTVLEALYDPAGTVLNFDATFEQHSEGATPALFGEIKYESGQMRVTATAGTTVTYTLTAANHGPSD